MTTALGDGTWALFWEDRSMDGYRMEELAPTVYAKVLNRIRKQLLVKDAVQNGMWATSIGPNLDAPTLMEFIALWTQVQGIQLQEGIPDIVKWAWERDGQYSARSAYAAKFMGREIAPTAEAMWKCRAPLQCRFFTWLAVRNRCRTSDRLARRGLPHQQTCPLCSQDDETMNHIMLQCVFARTFWMQVCYALGMPQWTPTIDDTLPEWILNKRIHGMKEKDVRVIIMLALWELWKHRNGIVFDGDTPSLGRLLARVLNEGKAWRTAGLLKSDLESFFGRLHRWDPSET